MTPDKIALVQSSFARLAPQADAVARAFYGRMFAIDPALRLPFPADLGGQRAKRMQMLAAAVQGLCDVRSEHCATVGQAQMDTLRSGLGADFTPPPARLAA
ncbi:hypothetical protein [Aquabacterium sp.]|uniref:hypothetical protein n=1 Tax=Aquabacterium sp. TaxID=1872578 RepID=UPI0037831DEA